MQTLAQILAGAGGNPYEPSAPSGGMSPLIQMLMQAQAQQGQGAPAMGGAPPEMPQAAGALGPGGIPQTQLPIPGQPQLPGLGSMGQPMGLGMGLGYGSGIY
jgi:hypothetical protein